MTARYICPFCCEDFGGVPLLCHGDFTDRAHPVVVAPVLVEYEADGRLADGEEARLARVRAIEGPREERSLPAARREPGPP